MSARKPFEKPTLKSIGNLDHINQRIECIQRHITVFQQKQNENPCAGNVEAIEAYTGELERIQKKYRLFLKSESYAE